MNRNQRRIRRPTKKIDSENKIKVHREKNGLQEVFSARKVRKETTEFNKAMTNRSCIASPNQRDFGQLTDAKLRNDPGLLYKESDIEPIIPDTLAQLKELKNMLCGNANKIENSCQYVTPNDPVLIPAYVKTSDGSQWQNIENIEDINKIVMNDKLTQKGSIPVHPANIHISEVPRVKVIAKKFSRCKKNNIEVRKLDEKIVCLEYDIFQEPDRNKPIQFMRAFFSIKPVVHKKDGAEKSATEVPSEIRRNFKIADEDLISLNEKEVEIIDGKISENKSYLNNLKKILRRKQTHVKEDNTSLDLRSLYEMAKRERSLSRMYSNTNMLTKAELKEVKDLILAKCSSSIHGVRYRTIKNENVSSEKVGVISQSIFAELLRDDEKMDVFE